MVQQASQIGGVGLIQCSHIVGRWAVIDWLPEHILRPINGQRVALRGGGFQMGVGPKVLLEQSGIARDAQLFQLFQQGVKSFRLIRRELRHQPLSILICECVHGQCSSPFRRVLRSMGPRCESSAHGLF